MGDEVPGRASEHEVALDGGEDGHGGGARLPVQLPGGDTVCDHPLEHRYQRVQHGAKADGDRWLSQCLTADVDPAAQGSGVLDGIEAQVGVDKGIHRYEGGWRVGLVELLLDMLQMLFAQDLHHVEQDIELVVEVVVDEPLVESSPPRDGAHPRRFEAVLGDEIHGRLDDLALSLFCVGWSWHSLLNAQLNYTSIRAMRHLEADPGGRRRRAFAPVSLQGLRLPAWRRDLAPRSGYQRGMPASPKHTTKAKWEELQRPDRDTQGLSAERLEAFWEDPRLVEAIDDAAARREQLEADNAELMSMPERELRPHLQRHYANFYTADSVNPYIPLAANGPWLVTSHGAVLHDSGGYGMLGLGHAPREVLAAMCEPWVMANVMTASFSAAVFADKLRQTVGHTRGGCPFTAFQCLNSGSEAMTLACRISDINAKHTTQAGGAAEGRRPVMLSVEGSFHGRTTRPARLSHATSRKYRLLLASHQDRSDIVTVPQDDVAALYEAFEDAEQNNRFIELVALEPVMGEGNPGHPLRRELYDAARALTKQHGGLLLVDAIQAGFRATGELSIVDYPAFRDAEPPDMETWSKAINAGQYPLSVLGLSERAADLFTPGVYGNTMTTNPRALAVASAVLDAIDASVRQNIVEMGKHMLAELGKLQQRHPKVVTHVQGTGLLLAAFVNPDIPVVGPDGLERRCRLRGIGVIHGGDNALRFTPHFRITPREIALIIDVLDEVLGQARPTVR